MLTLVKRPKVGGVGFNFHQGRPHIHYCSNHTD